MKYSNTLYLTAVFMFGGLFADAQVKIGGTSGMVDSMALLELQSTTQTFV